MTDVADLLRRAADAKLRVFIVGTKVRVDGPKQASSIAKEVIKNSATVRDHLELIELKVDHHPPESTLGRLSRNLLTWSRGEWEQIDDGIRRVSTADARRKSIFAMVEFLYAIIAAQKTSEPTSVMVEMIKAFKSIIASCRWRWQSREISFPEEMDVLTSRTASKQGLQIGVKK